MLLFTLFIFLNVIVAIKPRNLEVSKETNEDDFNVHTTFEDSSIKMKTASSEYVLDPDFSSNNNENSVGTNHRIKRYVTEETTLVTIKPIRLVRHRGTLKQDNNLKLPTLMMVNKTIDKINLHNKENIKSNTDAYTHEKEKDTVVNTANNSTARDIFGVNKKNANLDVNENIAATGSFGNENASLGNQSSLRVAKYDRNETEVIQDQFNQEPNQLNMKFSETDKNIHQNFLGTRQRYNHQMPMERNNFKFAPQQYKGDPNHPNMYQKLLGAAHGSDHHEFIEYNGVNINRPNMVSLESNRYNLYPKYGTARPKYNQEPMGRSGAGFVDYYDDYPGHSYHTYPKFSGQGNYQETMIDGEDAGFKEQNEGYDIQPSVYQKLLKARQKYNHHEPIYGNGEDFVAEKYEQYPIQPNINEDVVKAKDNNDVELMEKNDAGIATVLYDEDSHKPHIKSMEANGLLRHIRPKFSHHDVMERNRDEIEQYDDKEPTTPHSILFGMDKLLHDSRIFDNNEDTESRKVAVETGLYDKDQNIPKIETLEAYRRIHQKESQPIYDQQELLRENTAEEYYNVKPNGLYIKSSKMNGHRHIRPKLDYQDIIESSHDRTKAQPNTKSIDIGHSNILHYLPDTKEKLDQQIVKTKKEPGKDLEEYYDSNQLNIEGNAEMHEPVFEVISIPNQEVIEKDVAYVVAEQYNGEFQPDRKSGDTNLNMDTNKAVPELIKLKDADARNSDGPEYKKHLIDQNTFENLDVEEMLALRIAMKEINSDQPINLDQKKGVSDGAFSRFLQYVPRVPLAVVPKFGCHLVPICSRFYLFKRCTRLIIKCGLV